MAALARMGSTPGRPVFYRVLDFRRDASHPRLGCAGRRCAQRRRRAPGLPVCSRARVKRCRNHHSARLPFRGASGIGTRRACRGRRAFRAFARHCCACPRRCARGKCRLCADCGRRAGGGVDFRDASKNAQAFARKSACSVLKSTGLVRWWSKPTAAVRARSCTWP